jgi:ABC-type polysaccharide/polyol phosphate transport system ATPase subunit
VSGIRLEGVTLTRSTREEYAFDLKRSVFALVTGRYRRPRRRTVLDNVDLTIEPGEKVGLIGPNGAGKSTLLKVVCGILTPQRGTVVADGRIAPLIEFGAGFDPDLSVVDNIELYGTLLGRSRAEMLRKTDEILDFAELDDYRNATVRSLSSGMTARLGFSIATDIEPEILVLDEVLAVGDESFRKKSRRRIDQLWKEHVTVVLVSHDMSMIGEMCDRAIWMVNGAIRHDGPANETTAAYFADVETSATEKLAQMREQLEIAGG